MDPDPTHDSTANSNEPKIDNQVDVCAPHMPEPSATGGGRSTGYFRDYLDRLPINERLKIQQEIREGYRPGR